MRGYIAEMGEHPQTIGYSLLDSPIGLAAWMLDHDADSYAKIAQAFLDGEQTGRPQPGRRPRQHHALLGDGHRGVDVADLLGDRTAGKASLKDPPPHIKLPVAYTVFPDELFQAPRHWVKHAYHHLDLLQRGAEGRALRGVGGAGDLREEMRAAFASLRNGHAS